MNKYKVHYVSSRFAKTNLIDKWQDFTNWSEVEAESEGGAKIKFMKGKTVEPPIIYTVEEML